jgi:hypothetical protein
VRNQKGVEVQQPRLPRLLQLLDYAVPERQRAMLDAKKTKELSMNGNRSRWLDGEDT